MARPGSADDGRDKKVTPRVVEQILPSRLGQVLSAIPASSDPQCSNVVQKLLRQPSFGASFADVGLCLAIVCQSWPKSARLRTSAVESGQMLTNL